MFPFNKRKIVGVSSVQVSTEGCKHIHEVTLKPFYKGPLCCLDILLGMQVQAVFSVYIFFTLV